MFEAALNIAAEQIVEWTAYGNALVSARATAARGPRRRASTRPTPRSGGWRSRWRPTTQWSALVDVLGRPDWATDPALRTHAGRRAAHDLLDEKLAAWAAETDLDKAVDLLARRRRAGRARGRCPRSRRSTRSSSRAATTRPRASGDRRARAPVAAVPLRRRRPLDPHRRRRPLGQHNHEILTAARPLRRRDRRARGRRPDRHDPPAVGLVRNDHAHRPLRPRRRHRRRHPPHRAARHLDRARARVDARPGAAHRAHRRQRRVDGRRASGSAHPGYYSMAGWDGVMPVSIPKTFAEIPAAMYDADARLRFLDEQGIRRPGALPERRRLRQRLLPASGRPRARRPVRTRPTTTSSPTGAAPTRAAARRHRAAVLGRRPRHRRAAPLHRARPPGGELLQPAAGLRPAAARPRALGPGVGGGAGSGHLGQLPRRRRLDGHAVRRRGRAWGG